MELNLDKDDIILALAKSAMFDSLLTLAMKDSTVNYQGVILRMAKIITKVTKKTKNNKIMED